MLAKTVNDDALMLNERVVLRFFASKLAPTIERVKRVGRVSRVG
ncbi:hypothetical protein GCM10008969_24240 [Pseudomonas veronii subsp. inensis]